MKIQVTASKKQTSEGYANAMLLFRRRVGNKVVDMRAKTNIPIPLDRYDLQKKEAKEYSGRKLNTPDMAYNKEQIQQLKDLLAHIDKEWNRIEDKDNTPSNWMAEVVDRYLCPQKFVENKDGNIYKVYLEWVEKGKFSLSFSKGCMVAIRSVYRWQEYRRAEGEKKFTATLDQLTKNDIDDLRDFLLNEKQLEDEQPKLFEKIVSNYPEGLEATNITIKAKGRNSVDVLMRKLRQFFNWARKNKLTTNNPFEFFEFDGEQYISPYFLTLQEREQIATAEITDVKLSTQRDIFIFQCFTGCRVSDLVTLTKDNITADGVLVYSPKKTAKEGEKQTIARIPLTQKAKELIKKYDGMDRKGRLFPCISPQKYNNNIKIICQIAGIERKVSVRNSITGKTELKPIYEVASSHMARRTFVGNLYNLTPDPNVIGKMSGHVEGSKAFGRYREITDDVTRALIEKSEQRRK